jgi:pimeloyl-ACP methyl ester carboxylesterase
MFAEANGTQFYYEMAGVGPPLVLIHGLGADTRVWDDQFRMFARHYRVVRYDIRGHGRSAPITAPYSHADDLKALLDCLGIPNAHIAGQSMGGEIAVEFALAYPAMTHSLILVDAMLGGFELPPDWGESWAPFGAALAAHDPRAIDILLEHPFFDGIREQPEPLARLKQIFTDYFARPVPYPDPRQMPDPPAIQQLDRISAPTLVVVGARDIPPFREMSDQFLRGIHDAWGVTLLGAGHVTHMEAPEAFNALALDFLSEH